MTSGNVGASVCVVYVTLTRVVRSILWVCYTSSKYLVKKEVAIRTAIYSGSARCMKY